MIAYKINVKKIDKALLYAGEKGTYLSGIFVENKDGTDQYGNDGFIVQEVSKEARQAGEKGPILGNWRNVQTKAAPAPKPVSATPAAEDDDIPF